MHHVNFCFCDASWNHGKSGGDAPTKAYGAVVTSWQRQWSHDTSAKAVGAAGAYGAVVTLARMQKSSSHPVCSDDAYAKATGVRG